MGSGRRVQSRLPTGGLMSFDMLPVDRLRDLTVGFFVGLPNVYLSTRR